VLVRDLPLLIGPLPASTPAATTSDAPTPDRRLRGLLLYPAFPSSSFWSFRHVMPMVGARAAFPPLGLLTFAALMPEHWSFELIDLNVRRPPDAELRARIAAADAVFVSAMSVQKRSLLDVLDGAGRGLETPWVLGGPYASSFRDEILDPRTPSDEVLHRGLDLLVWGEGGQWAATIDRTLRTPEGRRHSDGRPTLLIPEAVAAQEPGSRRVLNDRSIFRELGTTPPPRWDLIDVGDYRAMMVQTTVGCRFRCDFCDIIQFNGGFTRPKTLESVRQELAALHAVGYRGGIFTVDDNFVGNPEAIAGILHEMIAFQREHGYPFSFYTQASLDLGSPKLAHLLPLMRQAGFEQVFLGIENPDPAALNAMNKKQNVKADIPRTVAAIQTAGIEVMAGFIFGGDADTPATAERIAAFAEEAAIPTAMAGMLTPIPHTPLTERLRAEGRLLPYEFSGNNVTDEVQFVPRGMTVDAMRAGYDAMLRRLFAPGATHRRSAALLERLRPHIFHARHGRRADLRAALRSLWRQGVVGGSRWAYWRLLSTAARLDRERFREAGRAAREVERLLEAHGRGAPVPHGDDAAALLALVDHARDAMVRAEPERSLDDVAEWAARLQERIAAGCLTADDPRSLYLWGREFFLLQRGLHRFPGAYVEKAFNLAIKGLHYEIVMNGIARAASDGRAARDERSTPLPLVAAAGPSP
jgi:radical SAM superfamily enzyme YgiQ (UPF0313 family)